MLHKTFLTKKTDIIKFVGINLNNNHAYRLFSLKFLILEDVEIFLIYKFSEIKSRV